MIEEHIKKIVGGKNLSRQEAKQAFSEIMNGEASPVQVSALLVALRMKIESIEEISGAADAMRSVVAEVKPKTKELLLDIVGTGGDEKNSFNISTASAFVAAGAGCRVAKHGNRSVSSNSGSADVLEKLGINIECSASRNAEIIDKCGIAFMFAPNHHPAMKHAMPVRKELRIKTIFNILGPLTNPAKAQTILLGVYGAELAEKLALSLAGLEIKKALVVRGVDGFDEISACSETTVFEVSDKEVEKKTISPKQFGFERCAEKELLASDSEESARHIKNVLSGQDKSGKLTSVLLNAGAGIYANGKAETISDGIEKARQSIISGNALSKIEILAELTNK